VDSERLSRKLAAILYADVAGYSRLTGDDEEGTHRQLGACLDLISETIKDKDGSVVHYAGDAVLADFATVSNALASAVSIQEKLAELNETLPEERRLMFRIGINLGEVIVDRNDIYGDGVNVAARLESLAEPGGICVAESVHTAMGKKLGLAYEFLGEQGVKNIEQPVRAYRVLLGKSQEQEAAREEPSALESREKPSIAVLPFANMSTDPEQEHFADGMTEDIITALSQLSALSVMARNSSFAYKGRSVKVQDVARDLGVRYVLEGSVRKAGQRARITAQLVDASDGHHLWAERYDRDLDDIFEVQDEITRNIAIALQVQLSFGEHTHIWQRGTQSFEAWQCQVRGVQAFYKFSREGRSEAAECFEKAVAIDSGYRPAWVALVHTYSQMARHGDPSDPDELLQRAEEIAERLQREDETLADAPGLLASIRLTQRRYEESIAAGREAIELEPNNPDQHGRLAGVLTYAGQAETALYHINRAIELSPHYPNWFTMYTVLARFVQGDLELAREAAEDAVARFPDFTMGYVNLVAVYSALGLTRQAGEVARKVLELQPAFSLDVFAKSLLFKDPSHTKAWIDHLRKAGLPE
jgi:TolB-like protein/Tfp pilus assembly protein PilF